MKRSTLLDALLSECECRNCQNVESEAILKIDMLKSAISKAVEKEMGATVCDHGVQLNFHDSSLGHVSIRIEMS